MSDYVQDLHSEGGPPLHPHRAPHDSLPFSKSNEHQDRINPGVPHDKLEDCAMKIYGRRYGDLDAEEKETVGSRVAVPLPDMSKEESFEQEISKAQAPIPKDQMEKLHRDLPGYPHHG